jgi:hypothetical protein
MFGGRRDIEQQPGFPGVGLLCEAQTEFAISESLCCVLKEFPLGQGRNARVTIFNVAFGHAGAQQQRRYRNLSVPKNGDGLPSGEPGRAW